MGGHERPYGFVPKTWDRRIKDSVTSFTQSKTMVGWGLNWKLKFSRFYGCLMLYG